MNKFTVCLAVLLLSWFASAAPRGGGFLVVSGPGVPSGPLFLHWGLTFTIYLHLHIAARTKAELCSYHSWAERGRGEGVCVCKTVGENSV